MITIEAARLEAERNNATVIEHDDRLMFWRDGVEIGSTLIDRNLPLPSVSRHAVERILS